MISTGMNALYQRSGLLHYRHAVCCNRSRCQSGFRPAFLYLDLISVSKEQLLLRSSHKYCLLSMCFTFLGKKAELKVRLMTLSEFSGKHALCKGHHKPWNLRLCHAAHKQPGIYMLQQCAFSDRWRFVHIGNDHRINVRQMVETPIYAIVEGSSPVLSYNYGAKRPARVRKSIFTMGLLVLLYTAVMWSVIILAPHALIAIFSSDSTLMDDAVKALNIYFAAFIFMDLQYIGQTTFKSLNKKKRAIFLLPASQGVHRCTADIYFCLTPLVWEPTVCLMAEPVSNVIGGSICFVTMLGTVLPELRRMEQ